ncbi:MAG: hypothetical protein WEG40_09475 [Candidatus Rokuibacteriota bacterium]
MSARQGGRTSPALTRLSLAGALVVFALVAGVAVVSAQTPASPPSQPGQPQTEQQPAAPPVAPTPPPQQVPLQEYPIQAPGRSPVTPATPPSTTLPPWTPPIAPPPSQTNIPAPFPAYTPGAPGAPLSQPGYVGRPGLTIPGAFAPTTAMVRGAFLEFHPTLRVSEEYSDNFFQTTSRAEDNFRSILGPGFTLLLNGARTFGTLSTTVDLVHDTAPDSGDDPKVHPSLNAAIRYALTPRLSLTVTENFVRDDEAANLDSFGIRRGRETSNRNTLGLTVDWLLDQIATQAYYRNVLFFSEDDGNATTGGGNRSDSITHILGLNAATRIATDYIVRAGYELSRTDNTGGGTITDDSTTHTVFGSVARQFGLYTTGGLSSSYSMQDREDSRILNVSVFGAYGLPTGLSVAGAVGYSILNSDSQDNEGTVSADVNASYRFTRAVISVGVQQDFRQTAQQGEDFGTVETRSYFGSFLYQLTPFINTVLSVRYSENEPTGTGNIDNDRTATALTYGASVNWQVLRWLTASLRYSYTKQTSGNNAFNQGAFGNGDYAENRASLNLFATF